jgi:hypothetical protein
METRRGYYKDINGKKTRVPGVTTVIGGSLGWSKDGLLHWANQQGLQGLTLEDARQPAMTVGTVVHACIEAELTEQPAPDYKGLPKEQRLQVMRALEAWARWQQLNRFELISSEWEGVHPGEGLDYGGRLDIAMLQGRMCLGDFKSSKGVYEDHLIQLAAYGQLWEANGMGAIAEYRVIRFGKDDASLHDHVWRAESMAAPWEAFQALLRLHNLRRYVKNML